MKRRTNMAKIPGLRRAKARQYFYVVRHGCPAHRVVLTSRGRYVFLDHAPYEVQNAIAAKALGAQYACGCPEFLETTRVKHQKTKFAADLAYFQGCRLDRRVRRNGAKFPAVLIPAHIDRALWEARVYVNVPRELDEYLARILQDHLNADLHLSLARIVMASKLQDYQDKGLAKACSLDATLPVQRYDGHVVRGHRSTMRTYLRPVLSLDRIVRSVVDAVRALLWASLKNHRANVLAMKNHQAATLAITSVSKGALTPGSHVDFGSSSHRLSVHVYDYPRGMADQRFIKTAPNFDLVLCLTGLSSGQALALRQLLLRHRDAIARIVNFRSKLNP
jgi:hypothetical protein